ncbi:MAG: hypothetical protein AB4426_12620 [Xenococcaceae cyanobacterium]
MSNLLRSLLLTTLLSFSAPIILVGGMLAALSVVSCVPGFALLGQTGANQMLEFLAIFGSGYPVQGILTIGFTSGIVGGLFDLFNFYRYQSLRGQ